MTDRREFLGAMMALFAGIVLPPPVRQTLGRIEIVAPWQTVEWTTHAYVMDYPFYHRIEQIDYVTGKLVLEPPLALPVRPDDYLFTAR